LALYYNNFGKLYRVQNRYEDAEPLYQHVLALIEKVYFHPHATLVLDNYADLLRQTNREAEAEKLEARAQAIREKHTQENQKT
jgi:hypothetical protein